MDKKKMDPAVSEKYVDTATTRMLEYYSANHANPLSVLPEDGIDFPKELDARCRADIRSALAKYRRKKCMRKTMRIFGSIACAFLVTLSLASVLILSVDALRVPVLNYFFNKTDQYTQITGDTDATQLPPVAFSLEDPLDGLISEEYVLSLSDVSPVSALAIYDTADGKVMLVSIAHLGSVTRLDSEGAQVYREFMFHGNPAVLIIENERVTVAWIREDLGLTCNIMATGLTEDQVISLAEQLNARLDTAPSVLG